MVMPFSQRFLLLVSGLALMWGSHSLCLSAERPNVLLILVDDLKPTIGCYGDPVARTPNIDRLATRSMRFDLAYCNQAVCAPSRFTLMLGSHSTSTGLYGLGDQLRQVIPEAVTLPQHFAQQGGYRTESIGKVFHIGHGNEGDPESFDVPHFHDKVIEYLDPKSTRGGELTREEALFTNQKLGQIRALPRGAAFESPEAEDTDYADGRVAEETVRRLRDAKRRCDEQGTPFLIATGFVRPHLPFSVPKKYWDLYDAAKLPMPAHEELPLAAPRVAGKRGGEIAAYDPVPEQGEFSDDLKRQLIHGYYASTSFVDAQIGKVIDELDRLGLSDDTIVVLWGDHGFHLGDLGIWTKHTNYEQANRIPLLIAAPGLPDGGLPEGGMCTQQLAESVDLFPTLAELAGLQTPSGPQPIDGLSLVPVLRDPAARVRDHAYHAFPKAKLGRAIRTDRFRLVQWKGPGENDRDAEYELYDYQSDPHERKNLAVENPAIVDSLKAVLATYPPPATRREPNPVRKRDSAGSPATVDRGELERALKSHDRGLLIKTGWIRDPYITLAPDGYYYLTGTTPNPGDPREISDRYNTGLGAHSIVGYQMQLWRSRDLIDWESLGTPFTLLDGYWAQKQPRRFSADDRTLWHLWAPEVHFFRGKWHLVHTSPAPVRRGSNLAVTRSDKIESPYTFPLGDLSLGRHDPSLFLDDDAVVYLLWGNTTLAPLTHDMSGFAGEPVRIDPAGSRMGPDGEPITRIGHEGATLRKIGDRYVHFGTAWSTDQGRKGSYNLYYSTAKKITGPYGERKFAGRFLGHGTPFQDSEGRWWCTAFFNGNVPPLPREGIEQRDLSEEAQTINPQGTTIVPLDVRILDDGDVSIRAKDPAYASPGPDEVQQFVFE